MPRLLLVDNYDSFTYNLEHYLVLAGATVDTIRRDMIRIGDIWSGRWDGVVLSPGPQRPRDTGLLLPLLESAPPDFPILGICLGMQAMGETTGMELVRAPLPVHGKTSLVRHSGQGIFTDIPDPMTVMRYHSLILSGKLPSDVVITAWTEDGLPMALSSLSRHWHGVQFHPESVLTPHGQQLLDNWVRLIG